MKILEFLLLILGLIQIFTGINNKGKEVNLNLMNSNDIEIDLYVVGPRYKSAVQIPLDKKQYYQIEAGTSGTYRVNGSSVTVNEFGTIIPKNETWYYYGGMAILEPIPGKEPDKIRIDYEEGISVVTATVGNNTFKINVTVKDYAFEYSKNILDSYVKSNITNKKTNLEKFESIIAFPAYYNYCTEYNYYLDIPIFKCGDYSASCRIILYLCEKAGIKCHTRLAQNDHKPEYRKGFCNTVGLIDGKIYIGEVEYDNKYANREYKIFEFNEGYSYESSGNDIIIYQYDGFNNNITVPSTIDGKTVIGFKSQCFLKGRYYGFLAEHYTPYSEADKILKIILPNSITSLGNETFNDLKNLAEVNIPIKVTSIDLNIFTGCKNLIAINVDKNNANYSSVDGVLFNKNKTKLIKCPYGKEGKYIAPKSLEIIEDYAFNETKKIEIIKFHDNVKYIGHKVFYGSNIKEIYFFGNQPEFEKNSFIYNITIYYPTNDSSWNISSFDNLGIKDLRLFAWEPKEEEYNPEEQEQGQEQEQERESNYEQKPQFKIIYLVLIIIIVIIIIVFISLFFIRRIRKKNSNNIDSVEGNLISE